MRKSVVRPHHDYEYISSLLRYDAETGIFYWKVKRSNKPKGSTAGTATVHGYIDISIDRKLYKGHRLAWFLTYGEWPKHEIDHINGVTIDNRISNLREATNAQNCLNRKAYQNNTSGYKGVHWHKASSRWVANIQVGKKRKHLGYFEVKEEAAKAYDKASKELHGEFGRPSKEQDKGGLRDALQEFAH